MAVPLLKTELDDSTWSTLSPLPSSVLGSPSKLLADHFTNRVTGKTCVTSSSSLCSSSSTVTSSSSASSSLATSTLTIGKVKEEPMDADDFLAAATATVTPTRFKITNAGGLTSSRVISAACITGGPRVCRLSAANVDDGEESERRLVPIVVHKEKDYGISRVGARPSGFHLLSFDACLPNED
ncbi:unnamed protein product [Notodromas monacha]|uniref:Uncharacterized protein n=1 Tax=Notodromas monacha TaxID=399045 RepID=A0A7R9GAH2_9CRUS|nr:unnamed protein product [Notodromas monacha]CAG0913702.1 unnamed protein product [Notodromas monacha]